MLVDEAKILVKAGHGGPGKVSFFPSSKAGPDGGNGGKGGDVYLKGTTDLMALRQFTVKKTVQAENGHGGESFQKSGLNGKDTTILVPVGTEVKAVRRRIIEPVVQLIGVKPPEVVVRPPEEEIFQIVDDGQTILIAKGGIGGKGNFELRSSRNTTPMTAQPGRNGEDKDLELQLKLIADFGLIGLPNAGKSSLLNELTAANPKIADYPFTTLEPNLGVYNAKILADIPGLIEGASAGKGLGIRFLKHIEKTHVLLHCVSAENEDVLAVYKTVRKELELYNPELLDKEEIVLLTKSDLVDVKELKKKLTELKKTKKQVMPISIHDWDSLEQLKKLIA